MEIRGRGKKDSKVCGLSTNKDGSAPFRPKEGLRGDQCSKANFSGFISIKNSLETISLENRNFSPLPGETAQFRQFASDRGNHSGGAQNSSWSNMRARTEKRRLRAEHKSLLEGGTPSPLSPHRLQDPRSRPPCVISSHFCDSTKEAPSNEHPAP